MSGNWSKMAMTTGGVAPKATSSAGSSSDAANRPAIPGVSRNATGTTTRAGESKVANRRSGARRMYATPAAAPQPAANASERPGCQPPSGLSAASAMAAVRLPTMIPAAPGRHPGASRSAIQSTSAAMVGPAKQQSRTTPTRLGGPASWATKNSGLPRRTSKSGCATARPQRLAMCSAARRPDTVTVLEVRGRGRRGRRRRPRPAARRAAGPATGSRPPSRRGRNRSACVVNGRLRHSNPFLKSEKLRQLAGHGADPFPTVDIAQVELYRLNRPFDQPTRIVVAEHG